MKKTMLLFVLLTGLIVMTACSKDPNKSKTFSVDDLNCMIDLHLHLDGAISIESAKALAKEQGIVLPQSDQELLSMMRVPDDCNDLNEFLEKFEFPSLFIQTETGIRLAVSNLLHELKDQGVMYAEIRFAPQKSTDKGLTQEAVVQAAIEGMKDVDMDAALILCCMRGNDNHEQNIETVNVAEKYLGKGVVALDLAGAEGLFPTKDFEDLFTLAREKGIPFTIHAGEADGPDSVRKAIEFGAVRIGHGVRSVEDEPLLKALADKQIPLELCPTSNINTAVYKKIEDWPLKNLMDSGIMITINTDDPSIEGTSIKKEYQKLMDTFSIGKEEVKQFLKNAVHASFAPEALKQKMLQTIDAEIN